MALIESTESSNRIEGVTVDHARLKPLVIGHSKPRDRSEEEIAGYRRALDLIHKNHANLKISPKTIQELHKQAAVNRGMLENGKKKITTLSKNILTAVLKLFLSQ